MTAAVPAARALQATVDRALIAGQRAGMLPESEGGALTGEGRRQLRSGRQQHVVVDMVLSHANGSLTACGAGTLARSW